LRPPARSCRATAVVCLRFTPRSCSGIRRVALHWLNWLVPIPASPSRIRRGLLSALTSALAITALVLVPIPASAAEDDTVGISLRPAESSGAFDGRSNFRYAVDPGQTVSDHAAVVNTGIETRVFTLLGTDAFNNDAGDFALLPTDQEPERLGRWVTFENGSNRMEITLEPGEGRLVPFTLTLPAEATPGDHAGGIVASVLTTGGQVALDRRVAIRVYARVSGDLQPRLAISGVQASYRGEWWNPFGGTVRVHYTIDNPGNVALAANVDGGVKTWFGIPAATAAGGTIKELLPGNSATYELEAPGVGQWGYLNPFVELAPFVDNDDPGTYVTVAPVSRDTVLLAIPWTVLILLAAVALFFVYRWWRRKRIAAQTEAWIAYTEAEAKRKAEAEREAVGAGAGGSER
jgi:hypothetical protein